ncbi:MAG: 16S rRNA (guanine(527)-N(7))-methyltransferase RsmG [Legionellaceae bacterium]|nr:16S rRNA (guanine(527)-N(7))-methyltransferase RsmG [Legionellaceae bacterium]
MPKAVAHEQSAKIDALLEYLALLHRWNQSHNLTAVRTMPEMVTKHLIDSLAIAPWIKGPRILDVGTGAGLPGIPLAIYFPQYQFVLVDSLGKKIHFLREVRRVLHLDNVEIIQSRVERYRSDTQFDTVVSRAFSSLSQWIGWTEHLISPQGRWLAMKGRHPEEELQALSYPYEVHPYTVPGVEGARCCVIITPHEDVKS